MKVKKIDTDYRELQKKRQEEQQKKKESEFKKLFEEHRERMRKLQEKNTSVVAGVILQKTNQDKANADYYNRLAGQMFGKWPDTKYDWGNGKC